MEKDPIDAFGIPDKLLRTLLDKPYRSQQESRRIECPHPDYSEAWVEVPGEWLGKHAALREKIILDTQHLESKELTGVCVALALSENFGDIPGIEGRDPAAWRVEEMPVPIMAWLSTVVTNDFLSAYVIPFPLSLNGGDGSKVSKTPKK